MIVKFLLESTKAVFLFVVYHSSLGGNFEGKESEGPFKGYECYSAVSRLEELVNPC